MYLCGKEGCWKSYYILLTSIYIMYIKWYPDHSKPGICSIRVTNAKDATQTYLELHRAPRIKELLRNADEISNHVIPFIAQNTSLNDFIEVKTEQSKTKSAIFQES